MSSIIDSLAKLAEKFSQKYPGEASGVATLDANARIPTDQAFSTGGSDTHKAMGVIDSQFTPVGNVGAGEDVLMSYTLPANTLDVDGKAIRITAWGSGNGLDNGTLKFSFGSSQTTISSGAPMTAWAGSIIVMRRGSNVQRTGLAMLVDAGASVINDFGPGQDMASAIVIKFSGENTTDTSDDAVKQLGMLVEILN